MTNPRRLRVTRDFDSPRVIAYLRVSTEEQGDSGAGLAAQRAAVTEYCSSRGWADVEIVEEVASAKSMDRRPQLAAALERLDSGRADILLASKLDRVSRSVIDFATLLKQASREGWRLALLDLGVDTSTPVGEMIANTLANMAQFERRLISQRTRDALAARKAAGVHVGRRSELPREVLARVVELREQGTSIRGIAAKLNEDGVLTAKGGEWRGSTVQSALATAALQAEEAAAARPQ